MSKSLSDIRFNEQGLVPVVVQAAETHEVLMLAWMNAHTVELTMTTGRATYWSRSRQEVWVKGATSGATQEVRELRVDCDGDTLLLLVKQTDGACHSGDRTCFDAGLLHDFEVAK